jgi:type IV secretory pathway VirB10-like protein
MADTIGKPFNRKLVLYGTLGFVAVASMGFLAMMASNNPVDARKKQEQEQEQREVKALQTGTEQAGKVAVAQIATKTQQELDREKEERREAEARRQREERERLEQMMKELGGGKTLPPGVPPPSGAPTARSGGFGGGDMDPELRRIMENNEAAKISTADIKPYESYSPSDGLNEGYAVAGVNAGIRNAEIASGDRDEEGNPLTAKARATEYQIQATNRRMNNLPPGTLQTTPPAGRPMVGQGQAQAGQAGQAGRSSNVGSSGFYEEGDDTFKVEQPRYSPTQYVLSEGSVMRAVLVNAINSQNAGDIIVRVTHDVYDSITGTRLLIPRGSRLIGTYQGTSVIGQDRIGVGFRRLILTDGRAIKLPEAKGGDRQGQSGVPGEYHSNIWRAVGSAAAVGIIAAMIRPKEPDQVSGSTVNIYGGSQQPTARQSVIDQVAPRITEKILERYGSAKPYFTADAGTELAVFMASDLAIPPFDHRGLPLQ